MAFEVPISSQDSEIELIKPDLILSMVTHFFCDLKYISHPRDNVKILFSFIILPQLFK